MKKILLSVGFAAAVIFSAQAQEAPTQPEQEVQEQQMTQEKPQTSQDEFQSEDLKRVTEAELPQEVKDSFEGSEFNEGTIEQAYEISGATVSRVLASRANAPSPGTEVPEKLYQLQVKEEQGAAILYIGDDGEIIASESM
ncbi:MAG: hypothetical protein RIG62_05800 [Cyclobacteriaceae bacterium]